MLVTMMVMGIVATSVMMVALRTFTDTATITNRRDVLADGRIALDRLAKQLRQGESLDQTTSSTSSIAFSSYIDGEAKDIVWRASGTSAPYSLQLSTDGGTSFVDILGELDSTALFSWTVSDGYVDEVTVTLPLQTNTQTVILSEAVQLRNSAT
jgi:type II secretory pathway pseudopilin PulG